MFSRVRLNIALCDGVFDEGANFTFRYWRQLNAREFVKMLPDSADLLAAIGTARNPDRNFVCQVADEARDAGRCQCNLIKGHWFAAAFEIPSSRFFRSTMLSL